MLLLISKYIQHNNLNGRRDVIEILKKEVYSIKKQNRTFTCSTARNVAHLMYTMLIAATKPAYNDSFDRVKHSVA